MNVWRQCQALAVVVVVKVGHVPRADPAELPFIGTILIRLTLAQWMNRMNRVLLEPGLLHSAVQYL